MRPDDQWHAAEQLEAALAAAILPIARRNAAGPWDLGSAPTHEQVDLVNSLQEVMRAIGEHCQMVMTHQPGRWAELANLLDVAARACGRQSMIDEGDESQSQ